MGIETFPEIENFQKLPHRVIVKGGELSFQASKGADLTGIVINNSGNDIRDIRVHAVLFDEDKIPILSQSVEAAPEKLAQGGIGSFAFRFEDSEKKITDYYLYTNWKFDEGD